MTRTTARTSHEFKNLFFGAFALLLVVCALYAYFVISSVVHVVMRKELNQEIASLGSYVSQLETQYIVAQQEVTASLATEKGYVTVGGKTFIDTSATAVALSR